MVVSTKIRRCGTSTARTVTGSFRWWWVPVLDTAVRVLGFRPDRQLYYTHTSTSCAHIT